MGKFNKILLVSLVLNYAHGLECIWSKFYEVEPEFYFFTKYFSSINQSVYFVGHGSFWFFIFMAFLLIKGGKWRIIPLSVYGTIFVTEAHHFVKGVAQMSYYPGMITSFFFPIVGYFYWKELVRLIHDKKSI